MGAMTKQPKRGTPTPTPAEDPLLTDAIPRTLCTPELADRLRQASRRTGAPASHHVRTAVVEYLTRLEKTP